MVSFTSVNKNRFLLGLCFRAKTPPDAAQRLRFDTDIRGDVILWKTLDELRKPVNKILVANLRFVLVKRGKLLNRINENFFRDQSAETLAVTNLFIKPLQIIKTDNADFCRFECLYVFV